MRKKVAVVLGAFALGTAAMVAAAGPAAACHDSTVQIWIDNDTCVSVNLELE